ncbi:MAG: AAA family ATPase [Dethiobacter sp.]|jgi:transitional endoplasmic reticulum ATPase|nr:MAG: AAA family ATPase [Dethiobacter sp.]
MTPKNDGFFLRIIEARAKDVGKGLARLDPSDIDALSLDSGDIIEIIGKRRAVARVLPSYPGERERHTMQIDGITRENSGAGIGEKVRVVKAQFRPALKIGLQLLAGPLEAGEKDVSYLSHIIEGLPLVKGDKIRVNLFGTGIQDYLVTSVNPECNVIVNLQTKFTLSGKSGVQERKQERITYEDVGGLWKELQKIREMIELPLKYPEVFTRLGIEAPKGVLLYGPPGTGKTLIARAVAHETEASFIHVNGPEIIHKFYGESEAHLRDIFEKAKSGAPSILFLDELDAIAPRRDEVTGEVEKRVVAQLLALMDGIESRGQVIIIGATNIPHALDPALRRPGRFDREITIGVPDPAARLEILQIHTRGMPLASDVDLDYLSKTTHGFVGADLAALCREAALTCLRNLFPQIDFSTGYLPEEILFSLKVSMDHFLNALKEIEPSSTREVIVEIPDVGWSSIGGLEAVKKQLREAVEWPLKYPRFFQEYDINPYKGILLYGLPGTGKTMLAKALARESELNFILVNGPSLLSKWVGESEKGLREIFRKAKQAAPCIVFFDEIDSLVPRRGSGLDSVVTDRLISQFLTEIDGLVELRGVFVLAATNRPDLLDPAVLRPGRFDLLLEISLPDQYDRFQIIMINMQHKPLSQEVSLEKISLMTEGMSGAEISALCREAALEALREVIILDKVQKLENSTPVIQWIHFQRAFNQIRSCEVRK